MFLRKLKIASKVEKYLPWEEDLEYPPWGLSPLDKKSVRESPQKFPEMSELRMDDVHWLATTNKASQDKFYHVTPTKNIPSIMKKGLIPSSPEDMNDEKGIYLFKDKEFAIDAVMNWLGDRFDEDEPLTLLSVDKAKLQETSNPVFETGAGFEVLVKRPISPDAIKIEEDL